MTKSIKPIRTDADHEAALDEIDRLWNAKPGTPDGDRFEVIAVLVEDYEKKNYPIDPPTAIEAIEFYIEQMGLGRKALEKMIGSHARVSEILTGKRPLTTAMMRRLNEGLGIPFVKIGKPARNIRERMYVITKRGVRKQAGRKNSTGQFELVKPAQRTSKRKLSPGQAKH